MTQVDVALTDYALAVECALFVYLLGRLRNTWSRPRHWLVLFFSSVAIATMTGGTVHAFFANHASLGYRVLWPITMIMIGLAALSGTHFALVLQGSCSIEAPVSYFLWGILAVYTVVVLWISSDFLIAILAYLPAVVYLGVVFLLTYRRYGKPVSVVGFLGVCVTLLAAVIQQAKISISAGFNYNSTYHVIQGLGLFLIYWAGREVCQRQQYQSQDMQAV